MVYDPDAELADPEEIAERVILGIATSLALQSGELPGLFEDAGSIPTRWSQADEDGFLAGFNEDVLGIPEAETSNAGKEPVENGNKSDTIGLEDIIIGRSTGAKAKNYNIELPNKEIVHLTEGTRITNIQTIAGKGRNRQIDEIDILIERFGGSEGEWQKKKGFGYVDYHGESYRAQLHWYEEPVAGKHKWKVKPDADGNWFIDED